MAEKPTYEELEQRVLELEKTELERKIAVDALRESEANTKAILEAMPDLMFRLSTKGEHLDFFAPSIDKLYLLLVTGYMNIPDIIRKRSWPSPIFYSNQSTPKISN